MLNSRALLLWIAPLALIGASCSNNTGLRQTTGTSSAAGISGSGGVTGEGGTLGHGGASAAVSGGAIGPDAGVPGGGIAGSSGSAGASSAGAASGGNGGRASGGISETGGRSSGSIGSSAGAGGSERGGRGGGGSGNGGSSGVSSTVGGAGAAGTGGGKTGGAGTGGTSRGTGGVAGGGGNGGSGAAGGTGSSTGTGKLSLGDLAKAFCAAARQCCAKGGFPANQLSDCEPKFSSRFYAGAFVDRGTITLNQTALATCVAGYNQAATTCAFAPVLKACAGVLAGTKGEGESCGIGGTSFMAGAEECKQSDGLAWCVWTGDSSDPAVTGSCRKVTRGKNGDACSGSCATGQNCMVDQVGAPPSMTVCFEEDGLYCKTRVSPAVCARIVADGQVCVSDEVCSSRSYCDKSGDQPECKPGPTLGQPCGDGGSCPDGLACTGADPKCTDQGLADEYRSCVGIPSAP